MALPGGIILGRSQVRVPGWPGETQAVIPQLRADGLMLRVSPPSLGLGFPLWRQLWNGLGRPLSKPLRLSFLVCIMRGLIPSPQRGVRFE